MIKSVSALVVAAVFGATVIVPATAASSGGATSAAASRGESAAAQLHVKPQAAGAIEIDAQDLATGSDPVSIVVEVGDSMLDATVEVTGAGAVDVLSTRSRLDEGRAEVSITIDNSPVTGDIESAVLADASGSIVTATLSAIDAEGESRSASDTVWAEEFASTTIVSEAGEQDLRLQRIEVLESAGTITAAEAQDLTTKVLGGGAGSASLVTPGSCVDLCVSGTVSWTDSEGNTHPVDRAQVEIRDQDTGDDVVVTTVTTDADGAYTAGIDNLDGDNTGRDIYVRVGASGPGFTLDQFIDSPVDLDVPTGSVVTQDLTANMVDDNNTAFSIHAALVFANDYLTTLRDRPFDVVPVVFPAEGSFYDGTSLHILAPDRWDWDVSLHEYGHFIADVLNIERNPGGPHSGSDNLSDSTGSKRNGIPLAFGEGWPTYFAVSALYETARGLGIPNVGDTKYQDTEDLEITTNLESNRATLGEDNEVTVMAILWDLFDSNNEGRDRIRLGAQRVWDVLDAGDPHNLSDAYGLFSPNQRTRRVNCVFTQLNVSPTIRGRSVQYLDRDSASPTIGWIRGNGGTHENDEFRVVYMSASGRRLFSTGNLTTRSYQASAADWDSITSGARGRVRVAIVGLQTDRPVTGPYRSCETTFVLRGRG